MKAIEEISVEELRVWAMFILAEAPGYADSLQAFDELARRLAAAQRCQEINYLEKAELRARNEHLVMILIGIHNLLSPPDIEANGKTWRFSYPADLKPQEILRHLSEQIRAIPDKVKQDLIQAAPQPEDKT